MTPLASRVLIAIPLLVAAIYAAYVGGWVLAGGGIVVGILALHEFYAMTRQYRPLIPAGFAGLVVAIAAIHLGGVQWAGVAIPGVLLLAFWLSAVSEVRQSATAQLAVTVLGVVWIGYGLGFLVAVRDIPGPDDWGRELLLGVLIGAWVSDTAAYLFGRMFGRRRLASQISPNKTVEGLVAGLVFGFAAVFFTVYHEPTAVPLAPIHAVELALAVTIAAPLGDLFESYLKRDMGVKDTGTVLGGHGGVLDRIDSLLACAPVVWLLLAAFVR